MVLQAHRPRRSAAALAWFWRLWSVSAMVGAARARGAHTQRHLSGGAPLACARSLNTQRHVSGGRGPARVRSQPHHAAVSVWGFLVGAP